MTLLWIIIGVIIITALYLWSLYNGLIGLKNEIEEAASQIDVQLKRRADLIPNLIETVKGYAKHEKTVFSEVTKARTLLMGAGSLEKKVAANDLLSGALSRLLAIAENYPQLKANENFVQLQKELSDTEDKVAYARQYYVTSVKDYNVRIQTFPNNLLSEQLGFKAKEYFEATGAEQEKVKVDFS